MKLDGRLEVRLDRHQRLQFTELATWLGYKSIAQMIRDVLTKLHAQLSEERSKQS